MTLTQACERAAANRASWAIDYSVWVLGRKAYILPSVGSVVPKGAALHYCTVTLKENTVKKYTVEVSPALPPQELNELDRNVGGNYTFTCNDEEHALDIFHSTVPIKVLDDFDISVYPTEEPSR